MGVLARAFFEVRQVLRLQQGLPSLLLREVHSGKERASVDRDLGSSERQPRVESHTGDAPYRKMHVLRRVREGVPVNIPLNLINQKMSLTVKEAFDYKSGYDPDVHPPLIVFNPEDKEDFIK